MMTQRAKQPDATWQNPSVLPDDDQTIKASLVSNSGSKNKKPYSDLSLVKPSDVLKHGLHKIFESGGTPNPKPKPALKPQNPKGHTSSPFGAFNHGHKTWVDPSYGQGTHPGGRLNGVKKADHLDFFGLTRIGGIAETQKKGVVSGFTEEDEVMLGKLTDAQRRAEEKKIRLEIGELPKPDNT
jgi:hypothetical protein